MDVELPDAGYVSLSTPTGIVNTRRGPEQAYSQNGGGAPNEFLPDVLLYASSSTNAGRTARALVRVGVTHKLSATVSHFGRRDGTKMSDQEGRLGAEQAALQRSRRDVACIMNS